MSNMMHRIACLDMVEDRTRNRAVGVGILFALFLVVMTDLIRYTPGNPYELVSSLTFVSQVPGHSKVGQLLSERPIVISVTSTISKPFVTRHCPGALEVLDENTCGEPGDPNYDQTEPVRLRARVADVSYPSERVNTLDC
jgi:hypothetical protein